MSAALAAVPFLLAAIAQAAPAWNNAFINHDSSRVFVAPESLNVITTRYHDAVILKVVNPSATEDVTARITIDGVPDPAFTQYRVWSPDINDQNTLDLPNKIHIEESQTDPEFTFPAHSVTLPRTKG